MLHAAFKDIADRFKFGGVEEGGIIGSRGGIVTDFFYDAAGVSSEDSYEPDSKLFSGVIRDWAARGIRFAGLVHSHVGGCMELSPSDMGYFSDISSVFGGRLYFPVVCRSGGKVYMAVHILENGVWGREGYTLL